jgi:hypothetical protein
MTPIVSDKDEPLELHVRQQFAISTHESNGEVIHILTQKTARMLAEKIMAEKRFFDLKIEGSYGTLRTDVIVMTVDEFFAWSHRKFREGFDHAQGYMSVHWKEQP